MAEINTVDDLTTFLTALAKDHTLPKHNAAGMTFILSPDGLRITGIHGGRVYDKVVPWILVIMSNGADVQAAIADINKELFSA